MRLRAAAARTLLLGTQGDEVVELQERLRNLGYDPGLPDGQFGYLTQDAVTAFQRDFGLRVDGVAGPRVLSLLRQPALPGRRKVYVLGAGETLSDVARYMGVTLESLRQLNHLAPRAKGYPGQRLICRWHQVVAYMQPTMAGLRAAERLTPLLSATAVPLVEVRNGHLHVTPLSDNLREFLSRTGLPVWIAVVPPNQSASAAIAPEPGVGVPKPVVRSTSAQVDVATLVNRRSLRKAAASELAELSSKEKAGIWLDLGKPRWGDGPGLVALVRALRAELDKTGRPLMVTLPLPEGDARWRWWLTDVDYAALANAADKVVLGGHLPSSLDTYALYVRRLEAILSMVPAWKCLLGIGLRAEERDVRGNWLGELAYPRAVTTAYLAGTKPKWDAGRKLLRAHITAVPMESKGGDRQGNTAVRDQALTNNIDTRTPEVGRNVSPPSTEPDTDSARVLWLPGRDAVAERLSLLHQLNLGGAALWPVGEEDARIWDEVPRRIAPDHFGT